MNERLRKLRLTLDLTQREIAEKVGSSVGTWTNYETGRRSPSKYVVENICKTFSVNEEWLRTGVGSMFIERERSEEIAEFLNQLMADQPESFRRRFVALASHLSPSDWEAVENFVNQLSPPSERDEEREIERAVEREVEAYRLQLLAEKKAAAKSSRSSASGGG